jgi:hypothetical protein
MRALNFQHVRNTPEFMTSKKNILICTCGESFQDVVVGVARVGLCHMCLGKKIVLADSVAIGPRNITRLSLAAPPPPTSSGPTANRCIIVF